MNSKDPNHEAALQAQAEQAEHGGLPASGDAALDRHRLVLRALRVPPAEQLPADFAARVAARAMAADGKTTLEDVLTTLLLLVLAVAGFVYVQPVMASVLSQLSLEVPSLPSLPWPLLGATLAAVAIAWALDRVGWKEHRG